jgi:hypothetical protein
MLDNWIVTFISWKIVVTFSVLIFRENQKAQSDRSDRYPTVLLTARSGNMLGCLTWTYLASAALPALQKTFEEPMRWCNDNNQLNIIIIIKQYNSTHYNSIVVNNHQYKYTSCAMKLCLNTWNTIKTHITCQAKQAKLSGSLPFNALLATDDFAALASNQNVQLQHDLENMVCPSPLYQPKESWRCRSRRTDKLKRLKSGSVSKPCTPGEHQNSW